MSHRINLMRVNHRFEPAIVREFDQERVTLAKARIKAGSYDGGGAVNVAEDRLADHVESLPLAVIGQGTSQTSISEDDISDRGGVIGVVAVCGLIVGLGFVIWFGL